jgi:hypothetical protein
MEAGKKASKVVVDINSPVVLSKIPMEVLTVCT